MNGDIRRLESAQQSVNLALSSVKSAYQGTKNDLVMELLIDMIDTLNRMDGRLKRMVGYCEDSKAEEK